MAMGRQGDCQGDLVVSWSEMPRSPGHVFYDRLQEVLIGAGFDGYVEAICAPYYAQRNGAPSVPPGRYFRMHMVGYFEGIDSERGIEWRCSDSLSLRAFLRLETSERVPDHSWLSRTRGRLPHEVHDRVFGWVLSLLAEHGLVRGARIGVDASTMEANAALRHIVRRDTGEDYRAMLARMARESGIETPSAEDLVRLDRKRKGRKLSNQAWVSETDPQARVARMKNGTTHLAYKPEHAVDLDTGAVAAAELHPADKGDTRTIEGTLASAKSHLSDAGGQPSSDAPAECVADKGYHSRAVLKGLDGGPWTSRIAEPRRAAFSRWHGDEEARRAVYNNRARLQSGIGKEAMRKRAEIVERSFAHILDRGGMRRTWLRGRENIHKRYLIHVAGHNLGLLMRLLVGAGTPKEAVARGWGFFLAQSPGDGASNTAILLFWITSASDPDAIACVITESPKPAEPPFRQRAVKRKAQRPVVLDDLLADRHDRQVNGGLATVVAGRPEQGQIGRVSQRPGLPERLPTVDAERLEGIGRGQAADRGGAQSGAFLQGSEVTVGPVAMRHDPQPPSWDSPSICRSPSRTANRPTPVGSSVVSQSE